MEEKEEVERILRTLSENVGGEAEGITTSLKILAQLDLIAAKGYLATIACCNSRNFYIHADGRAECEVCGIIGHLVPDGDGVKFEYPPEMMERARMCFQIPYL